MKLLFSEHKADYAHYIFPYAVWGVPEAGETPGHFFDHGFLPSSRELDRFYLCRHVRVNLRQYKPSSENRRVLRKGEGITARLVSRAEFDYTPARREFYKTYADIKFGKDTMTYERLDSLFSGRITSHVLLFQDTKGPGEIGAVTLYLEPGRMAYYYYAFYDLKYYSRNLGMFMMTKAVELFSGEGYDFLYLGSCYSANALYKTQFAGAGFFNGVRWSDDLEELKYLIQRDHKEVRQHLLETEEYRDLYWGGGFASLAAATRFQVKLKG
jgi:arginyl-tRNA--protein-N-Asp/Glu arginylyltransferase